MISIIVPIYNAQEYLNHCINSVLQQTYRKFELLLIDDGSTDKSAEMCDTFALLDKRIKVIHTQNGGTSAARNVGIEHSKGEFITFVDADDSLERNALQLLMDSPADLIIGDFKLGDDYMFPYNQILGKDATRDYLIDYLNKPTGHSMFVYVWGKLFKASIIKEHNIRFNEQLRIFEDSLFNMHYLRYTDSVYYVRDYLYVYNTSNHPSAEYNIFGDLFQFKTAVHSVSLYLGDNSHYYQACVSFAIRQMIRYFSLNAPINLSQIYELVKIIINDTDIRHGVWYYNRCKGDSWLIPLFMRMRFVWGVMFACALRVR